MRAGRWVIVNIASIAARHGLKDRRLCRQQTGLIGLTLCVRFAAYNIRANAARGDRTEMTAACARTPCWAVAGGYSSGAFGSA
jgi:hypothetical protein